MSLCVVSSSEGWKGRLVANMTAKQKRVQQQQATVSMQPITREQKLAIISNQQQFTTLDNILKTKLNTFNSELSNKLKNVKLIFQQQQEMESEAVLKSFIEKIDWRNTDISNDNNNAIKAILKMISETPVGCKLFQRILILRNNERKKIIFCSEDQNDFIKRPFFIFLDKDCLEKSCVCALFKNGELKKTRNFYMYLGSSNYKMKNFDLDTCLFHELVSYMHLLEDSLKLNEYTTLNNLFYKFSFDNMHINLNLDDEQFMTAYGLTFNGNDLTYDSVNETAYCLSRKDVNVGIRLSCISDENYSQYDWSYDVKIKKAFIEQIYEMIIAQNNK